MRSGIRLVVLAAVAAVCVFAPAGTASAQAVSQVTCPATFQVVHDDSIGSLQLAAGPYTITLLDGAELSCESASDLFRQFLEDYTGALPRPWRLDPTTATFTRGGRGTVGFRVARATTPSGGGGGRHPISHTSCPGFFQVLHNDSIGTFPVPAGEYRITLQSVGRLSCGRASRLFARFLLDFDGVLPFPWILDEQTGTFLRGGVNVGFRVKEASGTPVDPNGGGTHPSDGTRCPGTFRVLHNDRIGRLSLRRGPYIVTTLRGGSLSCSRASRLLTSFLQDVDGVLPRPWALNARTATFRQGRGSANGFRIKPAP